MVGSGLRSADAAAEELAEQLSLLRSNRLGDLASRPASEALGEIEAPFVQPHLSHLPGYAAGAGALAARSVR